jgi:acyl-CoA synthetase (AMP-forming)/AMP-acid ligase II
VSGRTRRTFAEIESRSNKLANGLLGLGLAKGERVGILLNNCAEYIEIDFALAKAGLARLALNARLSSKEHHYMLIDAEVSTVIYGSNFAETADQLRNEIPEIRHWIRVDYDRGLGSGLGYEDLLSNQSGEKPSLNNDPNDLFSLFYTSGTTGRPKGVMHTHHVMTCVARNLLLDCFDVTHEDRVLLIQPLSHGSGFFTLPAFMRGACSVILEGFDPEEVILTAEQEKISVIKLIPTMLIKLLDETKAKAGDKKLFRSIIYGASPMPVERLKEGLDRFGSVFTQIYGQAEAPATITVLSAEDHMISDSEEDHKRLSSVGRPFLMVKAEVVDPEGRVLPPGKQGELVVESDHVMAGYWRRPKLTADVLKNGRIHTRDIATVDDRGYIYLLGRADEMINSGGFNIAPREVEEVLHSHPSVAETAVIGMPHEKWGQSVHACVVLRPGFETTEAELISFTRSGLGFRHPKNVTFFTSLPRSPYGKVLKSELVDLVTKTHQMHGKEKNKKSRDPSV